MAVSGPASEAVSPGPAALASLPDSAALHHCVQRAEVHEGDHVELRYLSALARRPAVASLLREAATRHLAALTSSAAKCRAEAAYLGPSAALMEAIFVEAMGRAEAAGRQAAERGAACADAGEQLELLQVRHAAALSEAGRLRAQLAAAAVPVPAPAPRGAIKAPAWPRSLVAAAPDKCGGGGAPLFEHGRSDSAGDEQLGALTSEGGGGGGRLRLEQSPSEAPAAAVGAAAVGSRAAASAGGATSAAAARPPDGGASLSGGAAHPRQSPPSNSSAPVDLAAPAARGARQPSSAPATPLRRSPPDYAEGDAGSDGGGGVGYLLLRSGSHSGRQSGRGNGAEDLVGRAAAACSGGRGCGCGAAPGARRGSWPSPIPSASLAHRGAAAAAAGVGPGDAASASPPAAGGAAGGRLPSCPPPLTLEDFSYVDEADTITVYVPIPPGALGGLPPAAGSTRHRRDSVVDSGARADLSCDDSAGSGPDSESADDCEASGDSDQAVAGSAACGAAQEGAGEDLSSSSGGGRGRRRSARGAVPPPRARAILVELSEQAFRFTLALPSTGASSATPVAIFGVPSLHAPISPARSTVMLRGDRVVARLAKLTPGPWPAGPRLVRGRGAVLEGGEQMAFAPGELPTNEQLRGTEVWRLC